MNVAESNVKRYYLVALLNKNKFFEDSPDRFTSYQQKYQ